MEQARTERLPAPVLDEQHPTAHHGDGGAGGRMLLGGVQTTFERIKGVGEKTGRATPAGLKTTAGSCHAAVSSETTKHAESVKVVFDPQKISYGTLLRVFFSVVADPTQLNRQGPDVGTSYRSVIFYTTPEQEKIAKAYIAQLDAAKAFTKPIVTQVVPLKAFYDAKTITRTMRRRIRIIRIFRSAMFRRCGAEAQFPEFFQDYKHK